MPKVCDHASVGMLVWENDKLLLIERKRFPFGFAPPAGHVDGDVSYEEAAKRELKEEVGLEVKTMELAIEGRKENMCRRDDGGWHHWKIYKIKAGGEIRRSLDETKQSGWFSVDDLKGLGQKTEQYLAGNISEDDWQKNPGLEPVWSEWLKQLNII